MNVYSHSIGEQFPFILKNSKKHLWINGHTNPLMGDCLNTSKSVISEAIPLPRGGGQ